MFALDVTKDQKKYMVKKSPIALNTFLQSQLYQFLNFTNMAV